MGVFIFLVEKNNTVKNLKCVSCHHWSLTYKNVRIFSTCWMFMFGRYLSLFRALLWCVSIVYMFTEFLLIVIKHTQRWLGHSKLSKWDHLFYVHLFGHFYFWTFLNRILPGVHSIKRMLIIRQLCLETVDMVDPFLRDVVNILC